MSVFYKSIKFIRTSIIVLLVLTPAVAGASIWLSQEEPSSGCCPKSDSPDNTFYIVHGDYPNGSVYTSSDAGAGDATAYAVGPNGKVHAAHIDGNTVRFRAPLQGHHWVFYQHRELHDDTLQVSLAKYRFYNKYGEVEKSVFKEVRGRTIDSKYGRPPVKNAPFEIVLQKPIQEHHISCCIYSGDIVRLKVFLNQNPIHNASVKVITSSGWSTTLQPDSDGMASFEIPRDRYVDITKDRYHREYMLIQADYTADATGDFQGRPYRHIHYRMTQPIYFGPSPLEWAAKMPAFLLAFSVLLVSGFGIFLYRLLIKKRRLTRI